MLGELGSLLGAMAGKALDPLFWVFAPVVAYLAWKRNLLLIFVAVFVAIAVNVAAIWGRGPEAYASTVMTGLLKAYLGWAFIICLVTVTIRKVKPSTPSTD